MGNFGVTGETMAVPDVKFARIIRRGMTGKDVLAHKRAISRAAPDLYPWHDFTPYAGDKFMRAVIQWKLRRHMNSQPVLGKTAHEVMERTHSATKPDEWAFDLLAIKLAFDYWRSTQVSPDKRIRQKGVDAAFFWYAHRASIAYSQFRPFQLGKPPWVPSRWDCSGFATACWFASGGLDPNGRGYDHLGYTGTLIDHGTRVSKIADLDPLDLIFYGATPYDRPGFPKGSPTHVAVYVGKIHDVPMVVSDGHYPMGFYRYNYRTVNHLRHYPTS
jgi:hypothetical protein